MERKLESFGFQPDIVRQQTAALPDLTREERERIKKVRRTILAKLKRRAASDDTECAHAEADALLCQLLQELGYLDIVEEYRRVPKWYA
jgi:hypothetical protein